MHKDVCLLGLHELEGFVDSEGLLRRRLQHGKVPVTCARSFHSQRNGASDWVARWAAVAARRTLAAEAHARQRRRAFTRYCWRNLS